VGAVLVDCRKVGSKTFYVYGSGLGYFVGCLRIARGYGWVVEFYTRLELEIAMAWWLFVFGVISY
jgi:hypothetical protein